MIVIPIKIYPGGDHALAEEIGSIEIANVGGTESNGVYLATLKQQDTGDTITIEVKGHAREQGIWPLLRLILNSTATFPRSRRSQPVMCMALDKWGEYNCDLPKGHEGTTWPRAKQHRAHRHGRTFVWTGHRPAREVT